MHRTYSGIYWKKMVDSRKRTKKNNLSFYTADSYIIQYDACNIFLIIVFTKWHSVRMRQFCQHVDRDGENGDVWKRQYNYKFQDNFHRTSIRTYSRTRVHATGFSASVHFESIFFFFLSSASILSITICAQVYER